MELIDPKMSIDTIKSYIEVWDCKGCLPDGGTQHNVMAVDDLQYLPTIEAEPVCYARWVNDTFCSNCNRFPVPAGVSVGISDKELTKYFSRCPHCGAKMMESDDNDT